jgi:hypothetical protein
MANDPLSLRGHGNKYLAVDAGGPPSLLRSTQGLSWGEAAAAGQPVVKTLMMHQWPSRIQLRP